MDALLYCNNFSWFGVDVMLSIKCILVNVKLQGVLVSRFGFTRVELFMAR